MKQKTKQNKKIKVARTRRPKVQSYPTHYLAIALSAVMLIEGIAIGSTTSTDWRQATQVLDVSSAVAMTAADLVSTAEPAYDFAISVNKFYYLASIEMAALLDMSENIQDATLAVAGINQFYALATDEMTELLDISDEVTWVGQVSGIWIEN